MKVRSRASSSSADMITGDGWEKPRHTAKVSGSQINSPKDDLLSTNQFDLLDNNISATSQTRVDQENSAYNINADNSNENKIETPFRKYRQQPIFIKEEDIKETTKNLMSDKIIKNNIRIRQNDGNHTILAADKGTYEAIKLKLTEIGEEFYTYTPLENKPQTVILKNIYGIFTKKEILEEVDSMNI